MPKVYPDLCTETVLVTEWIEGERLSTSDADDVLTLCTTLLNTYLTMLLETGLLHADPHEGNLLRTKDGKVAILDWGLVTDVPPERSLALVEYISHLSSEDWDGVCRDLVALGFIPDGAPDPVESGLARPLGVLLGQLSRGGGAKGVDLGAVQDAMDGFSRDYPFQVPTYFALILRAFSVIEGIGLRADPTYSIVRSVFPYLARRLLTDDHPRARAALRQMLYGDAERLDVGRLRRLVRGFEKFDTAGLTAAAPTANARPPTVSKDTLDLLSLVLSADGTYLQSVLVDEVAAAADALSRDAAGRTLAAVLGGSASLPPALALDAADEAALANAREAVALVVDAASAARGGAVGGPAPPDAASAVAAFRGAVADLRPVAPSLAAGAVRTADLTLRAFARRVAARVAAGAAPPAEARAQDEYKAAVRVGGRGGVSGGVGGRGGVSGGVGAGFPEPVPSQQPARGGVAAVAAAALPALMLPLTAPLWLATTALAIVPPPPRQDK